MTGFKQIILNYCSALEMPDGSQSHNKLGMEIKLILTIKYHHVMHEISRNFIGMLKGISLFLLNSNLNWLPTVTNIETECYVNLDVM